MKIGISYWIAHCTYINDSLVIKERDLRDLMTLFNNGMVASTFEVNAESVNYA